MTKTLLMVINEDRFFLSHRKEIAVAALQAGWNVSIVTKDTGRRGEVEAMGLEFIELPINPTGKNIWQELTTLRFLLKLYRSRQGAVVHHVGMKNILWGSVAARLAGRKRIAGVLNAVSGLGNVLFRTGSYVSSVGLARILRKAVERDKVCFLFQNYDDATLFATMGITSGNAPKDGKIEYIKGSGVDLEEFAYCPEPEGFPIVVIFVGRMLRDKGVEDLVKAAELLKGKYKGKVEFWLCGDISANPRALDAKAVRALCDGEYVKWLGYRSDIPELLRQSAIMAFPSYYREGIPKALLEASAIGRPIVTCDTVGCRDTVTHGDNGYLVAPHYPEGLAKTIDQLLSDKELRRRMGKSSRFRAEREYDVRDVARRHLGIYELLVSDRRSKSRSSKS